MTQKLIKSCDCFLDLCIGLNYSLLDYHDFRRKYCDVSEGRNSEHLGKKIVTTFVCCLSCVKFLVNLLDVAGIKETIFIVCNREHLRFYYSNSYDDFYFHSDSEDTDFLIMIKKTKN